MGLYAVWSRSFVFTETVNYFSISSSVTGLSGREFMFSYLKYYLSFVFDFGVFILIVFAIESKKLLNLIGIGLLPFIVLSFTLRLCGCTLFVFLRSIFFYTMFCLSYFCVLGYLFCSICFTCFS